MKVRRLPNSVASVIGTAAWSASNLLMTMGLAKLGTVSEGAAYTLALALATPIFDFAFLGIRGLQNSDGKGEYTFGEYLALRTLGLLFSVLVLLVWAAVSTAPMYTRGITILFALRIVFDATIDIFNGLTQRLGRMDIVGMSMAARGLVGLFGFASGLWLGYGLVGALIGQACASLAMLLAVDFPAAARVARLADVRGQLGRLLQDGLRPVYRWPNLKSLFLLAFPLGITVLIVSANSQIGRLFSGRYLTAVDITAFGYVFTLTALLKLFVVALGVSASTGLGVSRANDDRLGFARTANRLVGLALLLAVVSSLVAWALGQPIVSLIFRPEYARDGVFILLVFVGGGLAAVASAQGIVLTALRQLRVQVPVYGAGLVCAIALNAWLMPILGARGAGWALIGSSFIIAVMSQIYIARGMREWSR